MGRKVVALPVLAADDILGVNARQHLAQAHVLMQAAHPGPLDDRRGEHRRPAQHVHRRPRRIGRDTTIFPFTVLSGAVKIGSNCRVGPFTHLRDGTVLGDGVELGAFVEVSKSHLEDGVVARHLAYLGNATSAQRRTSGPPPSRRTTTANGRKRPGSAGAR